MMALASDYYGFLRTVRLLCAMTFGGVVIFEVILLESLHTRLPPQTMMEVEAGIILRARKFMPWVIVLLYSSGLLMLKVHFPYLGQMPESHFGLLLMLKIALALVVLVCFIAAMTLHALNRMRPLLFKLIHLVVFVCVVGIVALAKAMFYA